MRSVMFYTVHSYPSIKGALKAKEDGHGPPALHTTAPRLSRDSLNDGDYQLQQQQLLCTRFTWNKSHGSAGQAALVLVKPGT